MKILFIKTPHNINDPNDYPLFRQPYGLCMISAFLKREGYDVTLWDPQPFLKTRRQIFEYIIDLNPDILGMGADTYQFGALVSFIQEVKRHMPNLKVILGGPHVTAEPESTMKNHPYVDWVCIGEGELVMLELLDKLEKELPIIDISGFACRDDDGKIVVNRQQQMVMDLDSLPFADWDSLLAEKYLSSLDSSTRYAPIMASRGCPYACIFCAAPVVTGRKVRKRSPEHFVNELVYLNEKHGVADFVFQDSTFNIDNKWVREICELILERLKTPITWQCTARGDCFDVETVKLMKKAGCNVLCIGVESADPDVLKKMKKGETVEEIRNALEHCKKMDLSVCATFILGMPGETKETLEKTIQLSEEVMKHRINQAGLLISTPLPGTELYQIAMEEGMEEIDWTKYDSHKIVYTPKTISRKEIEKAYRKALKRLYFNFSHALHRIRCMNSWERLKSDIHQAIGVFKRGQYITR